MTIHHVKKTKDRVLGVDPYLLTRFRWRADRCCRRLNRESRAVFYRWEVVELDGRWAVVAMQNVAVNL